MVATPHSIAGVYLFQRVIGSGVFTQDLLTELSPVTKPGQLRLPACHTGSRAVFIESPYRRTRVASVVATHPHSDEKDEI